MGGNQPNRGKNTRPVTVEILGCTAVWTINLSESYRQIATGSGVISLQIPKKKFTRESIPQEIHEHTQGGDLRVV